VSASEPPKVGYRLIPCPECQQEVIETFQGYLVDAETVEPAVGNVGLAMLPGGQVIMAGMGDPSENRYRMHDHQPEGLE
jgi:hypothetical protein